MLSLSKRRLNPIFVLFVILLMSTIREASLRSIVGEIETNFSQNVLKCDQIVCPTETFRCYVSKRPSDSNKEIERTNICYSEQNVVLKKSLTTEKLEDGDIGAELEINITRDGIVNIARMGTSGYREVDREQFDEHLKNVDQLIENVETLNENIQKSLDDIRISITQSLSHLF